jgi:hypothetical protein
MRLGELSMQSATRGFLDLPDAAYGFRITLPYATLFISPAFPGETPK